MSTEDETQAELVGPVEQQTEFDLLLNTMISNTMTSRANLFRQLSTEDVRDINHECGYPDTLSINDYKILYDREGISTRIVALFPEETWSQDPMVVSRQFVEVVEESTKEEKRKDEFRQKWELLQEKHNIYHYMSRIDEISGIGHFGVLLIGIDDGKTLDQPIDEVARAEGLLQEAKGSYNLMYLRPFDASVVEIATYDTRVQSRRYGFPETYILKIGQDYSASAKEQSTTEPQQQVTVHWTRILHVADNRKTSEIFGRPRMQHVYNRLYDLRKILGGSGEMFWKGGFPGYSFEVSPDVSGQVTIDKDSLKNQIDAYSNSLQRYLAIEGMTTKSLAPQVADPQSHVDIQMRAVAIAIGVPYRIFAGSEEAKLASSEDSKRWNKRLKKRQDRYVSPLMLRPFIDRLSTLGVIELPAEGYSIKWPDMNEQTGKQKAETFETKARGYNELIKGWAQGGLTTQDLYQAALDSGITKLSFEEFRENLREQGEM